MKKQLEGVFIEMYPIVLTQSPCGFLEIYVKFRNKNDTGPGYF